MPVNRKLDVRPTRNENSLAYHIPTTSSDYQRNSFFHRTVPDWNCPPEDTVCSSTPEFFSASLHEIPLQSGTPFLLAKGSRRQSLWGIVTVVCGHTIVGANCQIASHSVQQI